MSTSATTDSHKFWGTLKNLLSSRTATVFIILVVILSRIIQLVYYYNIYVDACYQVLGTQSFLDGHGVSLPNVLHTNLAETIYTPLINWPQGYSLLFAPFFRLFDNNYIAAGITIDILFAVGLIFICRSILKVLDIPLYLRNCFTLLTGFFIYYFYFNQCSDAIAITLFLTALYITLQLLKSGKKWFLSVLGISILLCCIALLKYLFIPAAFVIPAFLFLKGHSDKNSKTKKAGIYAFVILTIFVATLLVYQKQTGGSPVYVSSTERGFFPENLLASYPTFPASFIKPTTIDEVFPAKSEFTYGLWQILYVLFLFFFIGFFSKKIAGTGFKNLSLKSSFLYLATFLSFAIIGLLMILSLTVGKEVHSETFLWTYVQDGRYYGLINVLIHLGTFVLFQYAIMEKRKVLKYFCIFLFLLMIPEMLRGIYFDYNRVRRFGQEEYSWQKENMIQEYADKIIKDIRSKSTERIVVAGTSYHINHRVAINSHVPPMADVKALLNFDSLNTSKPVKLLAIIYQEHLSNFQPFINRNEVKLVGTFDGINFYTAYVIPH